MKPMTSVATLQSMRNPPSHHFLPDIYNASVISKDGASAGRWSPP